MNQSPPYILEKTNWKSIRENDFKVAVLPWGATEAHNFHLPYGTDNFQVRYVAAEAGKICWSEGGRSLILPCIPFGINTGQLDIPFCMNILPSTQLSILRDTCDVLQRHGIDKFVILNGHGGNSFKSMIRELSIAFPSLFVCWVNWYQVVDWHHYFAEPGDHAGEMETSAMLHIAPELVLPLDQAGPGRAKSFRVQALRDGWAVAQREWTKVTADTGVGNPHNARAESGKEYLQACTEGLAKFLLELEQTPLDDFYAE